MKKRLVGMILFGLFVFGACSNNNLEPVIEASELVIEVKGATEVAAQTEIENETDVQVEPEVEEEASEEPERVEQENQPTVDGDFTGFDRLLTLDLGLSIDEANEILGAPMSTTTTDLEGVESTTNIWMDMRSGGGVSKTVTFSDGYATSISETVAESSNVSVADYNEISTGMTEKEIYEVLGEPYSVMVMETLGTTSTIVSWINSDLSSITITFTNDVVSSIHQADLD